jgi:preprotein translocase subunit SecD
MMRVMRIVGVACAAVLLAGCATGERAGAKTGGPRGYVEFRTASYDDVPGYAITRPPREESRVFIAPDVILNERDIVSTTIVKLGETYGVGVEFNRRGARTLKEYTERNRGYVAFIIDGEVRIVLPILNPVPDGRMLLAGNFSQEEAAALVREIKMRIP